MSRLIVLIVLAFALPVHADSVMDKLSHFNPQDVFKNYTNNPSQVSLKPGEGQDTLKSAATNEVSQNKKANELYSHVQSRGKVKPNSNSTEMLDAEKLLEQADDVLKGGCYKVKDSCKRTQEKKTCLESLSFTSRQCQKPRTVTIESSTRTINRRISRNYQNEQTINLTECPQFDWSCTKANTVNIGETCEKLQVSASIYGYTLNVKRQPTCQNPEFTLDIPLFGYYSDLTISVAEYDSKDSFNKPSCNITSQTEQCTLERAECISPNTARIINGISIYRDCWGTVEYYQCGKVTYSSCSAILNEGCYQVQSTCKAQNGNICYKFEQEFSCSKEICSKEKEVCIKKVPCADGKCNQTIEEISKDFGEGVSKLGALIGTADDVYQNQVTSGTPQVFRGDSKECKKHPLGVRDCCKDSGWGGWVVHCPKDLQDLIKAKSEGRVVSLGSYKKKKWRSRHYVYCVFPSKLAGIVQIQGRGGQLGLSFGSATAPNCSGLTPEQLERIDFSALNLSALEQEFTSKKRLPDDLSSSQNNASHIEVLHQKGKPHD